MNNYQTIKILPLTVQNKIAAGEVVERPASVVKELIENALDAGATQIFVEIAGGGAQLIRITDDGAGMNKENLLLCIERHATSKITDVEDIFHIHTLGFRGEALPSIGSVAQLKIQTAPHDAATGWELSVRGGDVAAAIPCPPRAGTLVEVRELFFNTPARRKFMKSATAETAAINETITRLALAYPAVAFRVDNNGARALELPFAEDLRTRIGDLFGHELKLLPVNYQNGGVMIDGFIAAPPESRAQSRFVYTLLNRRWFRHAGLSRAVADACTGNLPPRRYPLAVLNFTLDPERVDVNAHPTKEVVRFENENLLIGSAHRAVSESMEAFATAKPANAPYNYERNVYAPVAASPLNAGALRIHEAVTEYAHKAKKSALAHFPPHLNPPSRATTTNTAKNAPPLLTPRFKFIAQLGDKYLLGETADGIMLFDQHALHERWNYEQLKKRATGATEKNAQQLLVPMEIALTASERATATDILPLLSEAGFSAKIVDDKLRIESYPQFIARAALPEICRDLLNDENADDKKTPLTMRREALWARLACRAAVLFGQGLSRELSENLIEKYLNNHLPACPHGRPTAIKITWAELATRFGR